jgi:3-isopropylmalate dehydrogenase
MKYNLVILPGDGIGPEVMQEGIKVLKRIEEIFSHKFELQYEKAGGAAIDSYGVPLPDQTLNSCKQADAVLKGPMGGPKWDQLENKLRPEAGILGLRKELGLFANLRPIKLYEPLKDASTLKPEVINGIDLLIVRELVSGIYFGEPRGIFGEGENKYGVNTEIYRTGEVSQVVRLSCELARARRKKLTSIDKFNVLESSRLWHDVAAEVSKNFQDVQFEHQIVDNAAMQLIRNPKQYDVLVTTNMFGDILSDEASMLTGSLGMLPSASLGGEVALYEPAGGAAPDIAGQNKANPLAMILSISMMLKYSFHLDRESLLIEQAVDKVLRQGFKTADLTNSKERSVSCIEMGDLITKEIVG